MMGDHVEEFKAEYELRYGRPPSDEEIELEEAREAVHADRTDDAAMERFKAAQVAVAEPRTQERTEAEAAGTRTVTSAASGEEGDASPAPDTVRVKGKGPQ
jgi:hypothetical protein